MSPPTFRLVSQPLQLRSEVTTQYFLDRGSTVIATNHLTFFGTVADFLLHLVATIDSLFKSA